MYINKRTFIRLVTYLSAAVIALGGYCLFNRQSVNAYRNTAAYGYEHAFSEVVLAVRNLDESLQKGIYTQGIEMSSEVSADIYADCLAAEMTMAALPFSTQELEQTAGFLGVAGDYAQSLLRNCAKFGFGDEERENLAALHEISASLAEKLTALQDDVNNGEVSMDDPENVFSGNTSSSLLSAAFLEFEEDFPELPELDYDGKYNKAAMEKGEATVSEESARKAAADMFGLKEKELELKYKNDNGVRCFETGDKSIVVNGDGEVLSMSSSRAVSGDMKQSEMEKIAQEFMDNAGFSDMELVYYEKDNGVLRLEFCCRQNSVLCTCDNIKLSVASDNGEIYSFDANDYIQNHSERETASPEVSSNLARAALPNTLSVSDEDLLMCETEGGNEKLCYAFNCESKSGDRVRVMVDAQTGEQYDISIDNKGK